MDDAVPSTSTATISQSSPPERRKQLNLGHLTLIEKQTVVNTCKQSLRDQPTLRMIAVVDNISVTTGAKSTVYRTLKEYKRTGIDNDSPHRGGRPKLIANVDEEPKNIVRQMVRGFFMKNELPELPTLDNGSYCLSNHT